MNEQIKKKNKKKNQASGYGVYLNSSKALSSTQQLKTLSVHTHHKTSYCSNPANQDADYRTLI